MGDNSKKQSLANRETDRNVDEFLNAITNKKRQSDSKTLLALMQQITGKEPKIWGTGIVAFGKYKYQRKNGDEFEWFNVGFSPAKSHLTVYVMYDINQETELIDALGDHKKGKGCLYIKKLDNINLDILKKIIAKSDRWQR